MPTKKSPLRETIEEEDDEKFVQRLNELLRIPSIGKDRTIIAKRIDTLSSELYEEARRILDTRG
ncbi:hypothetical protein HOL63_01565 [Candidatus Peregrinibacteria bacterium]|jgi:hypothetical protein|nr:hypothetical protein [Candidatus Peregrinibacteria bacterium]MBT5468143.1 hypothetical protein [Candidatus Peregrinibacteria bacterium]MBT7337953.1 hypothetical protein [Candidatus Peregrinibacteria bacterium]